MVSPTPPGFEDLKKLPIEEFLQRFPDPVLWVNLPEHEDAQTTSPGFETRSMGKVTFLDGENAQLVFPVKKAPAGFGEAIWIGRASNCDVVIRIPTLSKVHAMIKKNDDGSYAIGDLGSKNGTVVDGTKVEKGQTLALRDGAELRLGFIPMRFLLPKTFYDELQLTK
jgi:hypothetical protein